MFVDACALVSILGKEPDASIYEAAIDGAKEPWITALAVFETILVLARPTRLGTDYSATLDIVLLYLAGRGIVLKDLGPPEDVLRNAVLVAMRHGTSKKTLSTLDCFHYAAAKSAGSPMLTLDKLLRDTDITTLP